MDALATSISSFRAPGLQALPRELHHLRTPGAARHHHLPSAAKPTSVSARAASPPRRNYSCPIFPPHEAKPPKHYSPIVHDKAATGYAAALIDATRRRGSLGAVERDVRRLVKWLLSKQVRAFMADPSTEDEEKGQVLKEAADKGRFEGHLAALLKLLAEKKRVGLVGEVMVEFERIYDALCGTPVVLVSKAGARNVEEVELLGIARTVQGLSGAARVRVRHLIGGASGSFPSFAV